MKTRRRKKKPPEPGTFVKKRKDPEPGTIAGTVQLSNKSCPDYYIQVPGNVADDPKRCGCPPNRCWYDEQLARRAKSLLALTHDEWMRRIGKTTAQKPSFVEAWTEVISNIEIDLSPREDRIEGEKRRFTGAIERLRAHIDALEELVQMGNPTASIREGVTMAAVQAGNHAAVIDALIFEDK